MVSFLSNQYWWVRFAVLGPLAVQLHSYGWTMSHIVGLLGLAGVYGMVLTFASKVGSPSRRSSPNEATADDAVLLRSGAQLQPASIRLAVALFIIPLTLVLLTNVANIGAIFLLIGLSTCFVATCRFMIVGPLVLSIPAGAFAFVSEASIEYAAATAAAAAVGWVAVAQLGFVQPSTWQAPKARSLLGTLPSPGTTIRALTIGAMAVTVAAFVTPHLPEPDPVGPGITSIAGWGITDEADLLTRPDRSEDIVAWVWTDTPNYWRIATLDQWDGRRWTSSTTELAILRPGADGWLDLENNHQWSGGSVPTRVVQESVQFATSGATTTFGRPDTFSVRFDRETATLMSDRSVKVADAFAAQEQFSIVSQVPILSPELLIKHEPTEANLSEAFLATNLEASALSPILVELAAQITKDASSSYEKIKALEAWFDANIQYDLDSPIPPKGADPLEFLLLQDKTGYCEQMATSLVLMARSLGIPARMATGFVTNEYDGGKYIVRSQDAHAWTEVYFPEVGWVTFDPTDGTLPVSETDETETEFAAGNTLAATGILGVGGLILFGGWLAINQVRKPRRTWLERTSAKIFSLAGERFKLHERYTLADCLTGLAPPGTELHDDAQWLAGLLAGAAYGNAEIDTAERTRCTAIIKALRKAPQPKRRTPKKPDQGRAATGAADLSRIGERR